MAEDCEHTIVVENDHLFLIEKSGNVKEEIQVQEEAIECDFFQAGTEFESSREFEDAVQKYMDITHSVFTKVNSRTTEAYNRRHRSPIDGDVFKYAYMAFACKRFGEVKHAQGYQGLRKRKNNYRIGCKAKFGVYYQQSVKKYKLAGCVWEHNHPLGPEYDVIYPERRQLTDEESDAVRQMVDQNFCPKDIIDELDLHNKITNKDIKNFRQRLKVDPDLKLRRGSRCLPSSKDLLDHQYLRLDRRDPAEDALPDDVSLECSEQHQSPVSINQTSATSEGGLLSMEVIDSSAAAPAVDLQVEVWLLIPNNNSWVQITVARTDTEGRCAALLSSRQMTAGCYKLVLNTEPYFEKKGEITHFPHIEIEFKVRHGGQKFHIPVQLSANGYSTSCTVR